jgi:hypothetical protein
MQVFDRNEVPVVVLRRLTGGTCARRIVRLIEHATLTPTAFR